MRLCVLAATASAGIVATALEGIVAVLLFVDLPFVYYSQYYFKILNNS